MKSGKLHFFRACRTRAIAPLFAVLCFFASATEAFAYRPFDGTDAAVAATGGFELEVEPVGFERDGSQRALIAPMTTLTYGLAPGWELSFDGSATHGLPEGGKRFSFGDDDVLFKTMLRNGCLQDRPGPSIAAEFGALLPETGGDRGGAIMTGIVSQRWSWLTAHVNAAAVLSRQQHGDLALDLILEGPHNWTVRPVGEFGVEREFGTGTTTSGLIGAIWQVRDTLALDAGVRGAETNGRNSFEIRTGFTIDLGKLGLPRSAFGWTRRADAE